MNAVRKVVVKPFKNTCIAIIYSFLDTFFDFWHASESYIQLKCHLEISRVVIMTQAKLIFIFGQYCNGSSIINSSALQLTLTFCLHIHYKSDLGPGSGHSAKEGVNMPVNQ